MKLKWYASTLFLIICISFGAFQKQAVIPNQEIVLEFVDTKTNKNNIESTIADVKEKLLNVGISNISIQNNKNGTLKISYYSNLDIKEIKEILADDCKNLLSEHKKNKEETTSNYSIDIYELKVESDISGSHEKSILNTKYSSNRSTTNNTNAFLIKIQSEKANFLFKTNFKASKNNTYIKEKSSCIEPEVRAGPQFYNS